MFGHAETDPYTIITQLNPPTVVTTALTARFSLNTITDAYGTLLWSHNGSEVDPSYDNPPVDDELPAYREGELKTVSEVRS